MLLEFLETGRVLYVMLAVSVIGILSKFLVNGRYRKLIRQSEDMGNAKDKYLKQWKVKFENTYRSSSGVNNVQVYVERNLGQYKFLGIRLSKLERLNRLAAQLLCLGGLTAAFMTYWFADSARIVVLYGASGFLLGGAMVLWESLCNTPGKEKRLALCIQDYFENILSRRLESGREQEAVPVLSGGPDLAGAVLETAAMTADQPDGQALEQMRKNEEAAGREPDADFLRNRLERIASGRRDGAKRKLSAEEEHLIEDIIQEYLYE